MSEEKKLSKTEELAAQVQVLDSRTRLRKKPVKHPDYDYTHAISSDDHAQTSEYDEHEDRLLKRLHKLNHKHKSRLLHSTKNASRAALNPPPDLTYQQAFHEILHQSHMLKTAGRPKMGPLPPGETKLVEDPIEYLKSEVKGGHIQCVLIDLLHQEEPAAVLKSVTLPRRAMHDGMIYVVTENELVADVVKHFEGEDFKYAENIVVVPLAKDYCSSKAPAAPCKQKVPISEASNSLSIDEALIPYRTNSFCQSTSHTVLMMRRWGPKNKSTIVIQHQRTCDTCFYVYEGPHSYPWNQLYTSAETLLPKCSRGGKLQFLQLWGNDESVRDGWLKLLKK